MTPVLYVVVHHVASAGVVKSNRKKRVWKGKQIGANGIVIKVHRIIFELPLAIFTLFVLKVFHG